jgi:hypothetical protein
MINFKGCHFLTDIILMCIRFYVAYPLSYRHVEELMAERGVPVLIMPQLIDGLLNIHQRWKLNLEKSNILLAKAGGWTKRI